MRTWPAALAVVLAVAGCGGSTGRVSGVVTLDGQPLEGATVSFSPVSAGEVGGSTGKTDAKGRYTLRTVLGDSPGAAVGKHKVTISLYRENPNNPDQAGKELVPPRYSDPARTELTFDVPAGGTDKANFELMSPQPAKR
ncbi:MAG: carboxypeptidase regulatory-like domain-containing protein [Zavarzinella sp.]|nr:carboxypeptidase regulatory-like domain-containing protein [Zavarzinella sp.]